MRCETTQRMLQEYLDRQLPPAKMQAVEAHLVACATCREELALLRQVDEAMATAPILDEPADLAVQIIRQVRIEETNKLHQSLPTFRLPWEDILVSFAIAVAVAAVPLSLSYLQPQDTSIARASFQEMWWVLRSEFKHLWLIMQRDPTYTIWGISSLCTVVAALISTAVLVRQWPMQLRGWWL
jgi:anti-sigma factor RsiW